MRIEGGEYSAVATLLRALDQLLLAHIKHPCTLGQGRRRGCKRPVR